MLYIYYSTRNTLTRIHQKSADLRHVVSTALERNRKKYDLQTRQLRDTEGREKYRVYGELINAYGYNLGREFLSNAENTECKQDKIYYQNHKKQ